MIDTPKNSNCVILEFDEPLTLDQLSMIRLRVETNMIHGPRLPNLVACVCAERDGNVVTPTIAADED